MGRPGIQHEERVGILADVAVLAGFSSPVALADSCRPDVVAADFKTGRLFVADAKDSEHPGCNATRGRLMVYAASVRRWTRRGFRVRLAICFGRGSEAERWLETLVGVVVHADLISAEGGTFEIDRMTHLAWIDITPEQNSRV